MVIDFAECNYIDPEGIRWLAATKAAKDVAFADRRKNQTRREGERRTGEDAKRATIGRRRKPERRQREEF